MAVWAFCVKVTETGSAVRRRLISPNPSGGAIFAGPTLSFAVFRGLDCVTRDHKPRAGRFLKVVRERSDRMKPTAHDQRKRGQDSQRIVER